MKAITPSLCGLLVGLACCGDVRSESIPAPSLAANSVIVLWADHALHLQASATLLQRIVQTLNEHIASPKAGSNLALATGTIRERLLDLLADYSFFIAQPRNVPELWITVLDSAATADVATTTKVSAKSGPLPVQVTAMPTIRESLPEEFDNPPMILDADMEWTFEKPETP